MLQLHHDTYPNAEVPVTVRELGLWERGDPWEPELWGVVLVALLQTVVVSCCITTTPLLFLSSSKARSSTSSSSSEMQPSRGLHWQFLPLCWRRSAMLSPLLPPPLYKLDSGRTLDLEPERLWKGLKLLMGFNDLKGELKPPILWGDLKTFKGEEEVVVRGGYLDLLEEFLFFFSEEGWSQSTNKCEKQVQEGAEEGAAGKSLGRGRRK